MNTPRIRRGYVDVAHGQLHYRRVGAAGAPVVVLLHQTPSTSAMYELLMLALSDRFDLIAFDTPGFGNSDPLPGAFSIAAAANALSAAASQLHPSSCDWFGHHTGAALALQVAHDRPEQVRRLALSGPCLLDDALRERLPTVSSYVAPAVDGSHLQTLWERIAAKDADAPLALRQREFLAGVAAGTCYSEAYASVIATDTAAQLRALTCPTLLFAGTKDPLYPQLDAAHRLLARGRKAEIAGARTFVCERDTAEVARLLVDFYGATDV